MRSPRISLAVACIAAVCTGFFAGRAHAWTKTHVHSLAAQVDIQPDHRANVTFDIGVRVEGGWLRKLSLPGPGNEPALVPIEPPEFVSEAGERYVPEMRVHEDGETELRFEESAAPHRGDYRVSIRYRTTSVLQTTPGARRNYVRIESTLPSWNDNLQDVAIRVNALGEAHAPQLDANEGSLWSVERSHNSETNGTTLTYRRTYVPRETEWRFLIDVPANGSETSILASEPPANSPTRRSSGGGSPFPLGPSALLASLFAVAAAKRVLPAKAQRFVAASSPFGLLLLGALLYLLRSAIELDVARNAINAVTGERLAWASLIVAAMFAIERSPVKSIPKRFEVPATDRIEPGTREHSFDVR